jgi:hypothetical protein
VSVGPNDVSFVPAARAVVEALGRPPARPLQSTEALQAAAASVVRAAPLPPASPPADARLHTDRIAVVGMRESRAMAALAADIAAQIAEADATSIDPLLTRLREVIEIGSARDTGGPLAALYAAARRDPSAPLARVLAPGAADRRGFSAALADTIEALRGLDERFAARDFALAGPPKAKPATGPAGRLDLTV